MRGPGGVYKQAAVTGVPQSAVAGCIEGDCVIGLGAVLSSFSPHQDAAISEETSKAEAP